MQLICGPSGQCAHLFREEPILGKVQGLGSRQPVGERNRNGFSARGDEIEVASRPPIAPLSSAGSTSTVRVARQDKDVMVSGEPTKRSNRPKEAIVRKWREWILLQQRRKDLRAAGAADLLADHVARGHFVSRHSDFHQRPKCREGVHVDDLRRVH